MGTLLDTRSSPAEARQPDPAASVGDSDATMRALAELSDDQREVLMLVAWEGADARTGSEALGCSPGAFRIRLHRARRAYERAVQSAGEIDEAPSEAVKEAP